MKKKIVNDSGGVSMSFLKKNFLKMKLTFLCLFLSFVQLMANDSFSQSTRVTLNLKDVRVEDVLMKIEEQSNLYFIYNRNVVDVNRKVDISCTDQKITEILNEIFKGTDVAYEIQERHIILKSSSEQIDQQQKSVSGKVTDSYGASLPGVTVVVKGTTTGVITDVEGRYTLTKVPENAVLLFSFVGMKTQEIAVSGKNKLNVTMTEETVGIEEVVAIGYGTAKKSDLTGALGSVNSDKFKMQPLTQVSDILQGRSSGVVATSVTGRVNSTPRIRVRGTTSINKSSDALWVVDGVIDGIVLNPDDIASIEILKDASSTAIYGSRGANGVILVTTKHGQEGKTQISVSSNTSISNIAKNLDLLNAYEYALAYNDIMGTTTFDDDELAAYKNGSDGIDWVKLMTKTGVLQNYNLSFSGGNKKIKYNISGSVIDQTGMIITSKFKRFNLKANFDTQLTSWLNLTTNISLAKTSTQNPGGMGCFRNILQYSPTMELLNDDGVCNKDPYNSIQSSPWSDQKMCNDDTKNHIAEALLNFQIRLSKNLTFSILGNTTYNQTENYTFGSAKRYSGAQSYMSNSEAKNFKWQTTENLTYQKAFGGHNLILTGVFEAYKSEETALSISGNNLQSEKVYYWNVNNAETTSCSNSYADASMASVFSRAIYNYKGRYFVTGTIRADGSSKFTGNNKWGYFPSGALAWNLAKEDFMRNQNIFQQLKLRTSYGITGNQGIDSYSTLGLLTQEETTYATQTTKYTGYWQSTVSNPDLKWEKTYQWDAGLDISILNQRLNITLDWYRKETKDMLFEKSLPVYDGGGTFWTNQGELRNTGVEFNIDAAIVRNANFQWQCSLNASYNKNKIINLAGEDYIIPDESRTDPFTCAYIMKPGHPVGTYYLWKWLGFDDEGANLYRTTDGTTGKPSESDKILTGNSIPKWTIGWNNNLRWKNWEANIMFRAALGFDKLDVMHYTLSSISAQSNFIRLRDAYYKSWDYVTNKSDAKYPSFSNSNNVYAGPSTEWLENASFLRCQNITLAYHVPSKIVKVGELILSVSAQNLFTVTDYEGMDPETVSENNNDQQSGFDNGSYPLARTFNFGVKFNF
jgi:TonB-dependent starch-binding outer membrane protein SusC